MKELRAIELGLREVKKLKNKAREWNTEPEDLADISMAVEVLESMVGKYKEEETKLAEGDGLETLTEELEVCEHVDGMTLLEVFSGFSNPKGVNKEKVRKMLKYLNYSTIRVRAYGKQAARYNVRISTTERSEC